jgi:spermidine synthase
MKKTPSNPIPAEPVPPPPLRRGLRPYLYLTAGITGAAVMIVEILGAKMLAPYVGTSHFVWTAQIAVTLAALACGYYLGGLLVDRSSRLGRLYAAILIAAAWLTLTVALRETVVYGLLALPLPAASLLSSLILFFVPLSLLAMTGPFLIRVITSSVSDVGGNVGRLTAISTVGSFLGTAAIGYLLIPLLPNSITMYGTAALLAVVAFVFFLGWGRKPAALAAVVVLAAGVAASYWGQGAEALRIPRQEELYRGNSNFGILQVAQSADGRYRAYLNDYLVQNTYDTEQGRSASMFTYLLEGLAEAYVPKLEKVLCIGMGMGIVPRDLARRGLSVDAVEINPAVVPVAEKYFDLDPKAFRLFIGDGRYFLNHTTDRYDAVLLDAFLGDSSPSHLMSREAFASVKRVLKPDGVLVINTFVDYEAKRDFLGASLFKTLSSVFSAVRVHGARGANSLFVASPRATLNFVHLPVLSEVHSDALSEVREAFTHVWEPDPSFGILLTDDYNPVEYYDAANREKLRRALALSMKGH